MPNIVIEQVDGKLVGIDKETEEKVPININGVPVNPDGTIDVEHIDGTVGSGVSQWKQDGDGNLVPRDGEPISVGELSNSITFVGSQSGFEDPDTYINNNLSAGDTVYVVDGTHTVSELNPSAGNWTLILGGDLQPSGDHPVLTHESSTLTVIPHGGGLTAQNFASADYTSNVLNLHHYFRINGVLPVKGPATRVVNIEQRSGSDNLNHSNGVFFIDGADSGGSDSAEVGLMIDNSSGGANDVNNLQVGTWNAGSTTEYGVYANAGQGNRYAFGASNNGGAGVALYSGGGPYGASGTNHGDSVAWIRSDGNNGATDDYGSGLNKIRITGSINGGLAGLEGTQSAYLTGGVHRTLETFLEGTEYYGRGKPGTSELDSGRCMVYQSDGSDGNASGDLVYAVNDAGTIKTSVLAAMSNAT